MKTRPFLLILLMCWCQLFGEEGGWYVDASLGMGYSTYTEKGALSEVNSDWSAYTSSFAVNAVFFSGKLRPLLRLGLIGSDENTEIWKLDGVKVQENEMSMGQFESLVGLGYAFKVGEGEFMPFVAGRGRYQVFVRDAFTQFEPDGRSEDVNGEAEETVEALSLGGGLVFQSPVSQQWVFGLESAYFYVVDSDADNDAFQTTIDGDGGWLWESHLSIAKKLTNPGQQTFGMRLTADLQSLEGGVNDSNDEVLFEWPDSEWMNFGVELFWSGQF